MRALEEYAVWLVLAIAVGIVTVFAVYMVVLVLGHVVQGLEQ